MYSSTYPCLAPQPQAITISPNTVTFSSTFSCTGGSDRVCTYLTQQLSQENIYLQDEGDVAIVLNIDPEAIEHE